MPPSPSQPASIHADISEGDVNLSPSRRRFRERNIDTAAARLLERDEAAYLHQSLSTPCLNALASARGTILTDVQGRELLDFHGNSVHQVGHGHPRVIEAIKRQLDTLPFCPRRYTNEPAILLAERLAGLTHGKLSNVLLAPGGSLAMGMALKLARIATGRFKFLSMWGSFHGAGLDTISIGGEAVFRRGIGPLLPGCEHVQPCAPSDCKLGCRGSCTLACADEAVDVLEREGDIAAVILEPVRCTTIDVPPREYIQKIRAACSAHGALLILDEIPTCLGRTGRMFSYEHFDIEPDILVIGKGLGGGVMPIAAMLARPELNLASQTSLGHYTHEKSPVAAAAALATLDVIRDEDLVQRSDQLGARYREQLTARLRPTGVLRTVRGLGLMVGVELSAATTAATARLADRVLYECLERGLNFKVSDGRVLTLTPPLTVAEHELASSVDIIEAAIRSAINQPSIATLPDSIS